MELNLDAMGKFRMDSYFISPELVGVHFVKCKDIGFKIINVFGVVINQTLVVINISDVF